MMELVQYDLKPRVKKFLKNDLQKLYINGEYVPAIGQESFPVIDPSNEKVIAHVSKAQKEDINKAVQAARSILMMENGLRCQQQNVPG